MITKQERYDRAIYELREYKFRLELADTRDERGDCEASLAYWEQELAAAEAALKGTAPSEVEG